MIKRLLAWWNARQFEPGRDGVMVHRCPRITASGAMYWSVRDILFKPTRKSKGDA